MTDRIAGSEYAGDDERLDGLLARADAGVLETLSSGVDLDAGLADIFFRQPLRRTPRRRTSHKSSQESQALRRP